MAGARGKRWRTDLISLQHICKQFAGVTALDDVSLELNGGERVAVIGENGAGKSSLMNVLYGLYHPDSGQVLFDGVPARLRTPADALARGVGMVHQHFTLVPTLSVAENVVLGAEPTTALGLFDVAKANAEVAATCAKFGFSLDVKAQVGALTVGSQQKVEIVKALHRGVKTLILDEPTAVLTPQEADELFTVTKGLSEQGLTVVLISHKLRDVLRFASRIAVMRRSKKVAEVTPEETSPEKLAQLMIGDTGHTYGQVKALRLETANSGIRGPEVLEVRHLEAPGVHDVSLTLHAGEIVGIAGVDGNGQRELAELLTGLATWTSGSLLLEGVERQSWSPQSARRAGIAHVPEDRHRRAVVADMTVEENVALGRQGLAPFAKGRRIDFAGRRNRALELVEANDVRPPTPGLRGGALSGGNQQKLVVARELDSAPKVLVVVQPTRGLDIAAVAAVRGKLLAETARGCAVLLVSLDLDEVLALSDRVLVMFEGRLTGEFARGAYDEQHIGRAMLGMT